MRCIGSIHHHSNTWSETYCSQLKLTYGLNFFHETQCLPNMHQILEKPHLRSCKIWMQHIINKPSILSDHQIVLCGGLLETFFKPLKSSISTTFFKCAEIPKTIYRYILFMTNVISFSIKCMYFITRSFQMSCTGAGKLCQLVSARFIDASRYLSRDSYRDTLCKNRDTRDLATFLRFFIWMCHRHKLPVS